jgi:hypothetical protein
LLKKKDVVGFVLSATALSLGSASHPQKYSSFSSCACRGITARYSFAVTPTCERIVAINDKKKFLVLNLYQKKDCEKSVWVRKN